MNLNETERVARIKARLKKQYRLEHESFPIFDDGTLERIEDVESVTLKEVADHLDSIEPGDSDFKNAVDAVLLSRPYLQNKTWTWRWAEDECIHISFEP